MKIDTNIAIDLGKQLRIQLLPVEDRPQFAHNSALEAALGMRTDRRWTMGWSVEGVCRVLRYKQARC